MKHTQEEEIKLLIRAGMIQNVSLFRQLRQQKITFRDLRDAIADDIFRLLKIRKKLKLPKAKVKNENK